jgi:hypothetical protein
MLGLAAFLSPVLLAGTPAEPVSLRYQLKAEDPSCPSEAAFRALIAARLGYEPFQPDAGRVADVSITARSRRLLGELELRDAAGAPAGTRVLDAAPGACASLAESLALALAIAIDPQVLTREAPPPPPVIVLPPAPPPAPPPPSPPSPAAPAVASAVWSVEAGASGSVGLLPDAALGLWLGAGVGRERFGATVWGEIALANAVSVAGGTIDSSLLRAGVDGCARFSFAGVCLRASGGAINAGGQGFLNDRRGALAVATVGPLVFAEVRPSNALAIRVSAGTDVALIRNSLFVGLLEAWHAPPASFEAGLFVSWGFL